MPTGKVKWFDPRKGFGFITQDDGSGDIFAHYSAIKADEGEFKTIYEGDVVEYNVSDGQKGPQATDIKVIEKGPRQSHKSRRSDY
jgi:CspA family cold shock protein